MQKRNKHRCIGSFASSSFVFFFILLIATATSWIIQLTTVPETVRTVYYVMLRSCRHERFRWSTIQKVGVHKFDTDNMTQHGDAASWRGLLAYSSDCKTVIPYLYEYGTVVLDRYGFSKSRCTAWRDSARLLFLSMHACMHAQLLSTLSHTVRRTVYLPGITFFSSPGLARYTEVAHVWHILLYSTSTSTYIARIQYGCGILQCL